MKMKTLRFVIILVNILGIVLASCSPLPTPAQTQSNSPSTNNNYSTSSSDGNKILNIEETSVCNPRVLPIAINASGDTQEQIMNTDPWTNRLHWALIPENSELSMRFNISSIADSNNWIQLDKSLNVSVSVETNIPDHTDVFNGVGCGGAGNIRKFSQTPLQADMQNFTKEVIFSGADFFTLQPGEFEIFSIPFKCNTPGYYTISISTKYTYENQSGIIEFPDAHILCPSSYTVYSISTDDTIVGVESFKWQNGNYAKAP
jgi:hypothetical protein